MNLQELSQIGEFLGGLSVLLTLIYLAIQIRGNTKVVRSAGAQQTHDSMVELYRQLAGDAQLNRTFRVGTQDMGSLTEDEIGIFFAFWSATLFAVQNWCIFWPIPITHTGLIRSPVLEHTDHRFWFYSITFTGFPESVIGIQNG